MPKICMLALENPHCGVSGVPFMKRTTGADATALSIAVRTSLERNRAWKGVMKRIGAVGRVAGVLARVAARKAYGVIVSFIEKTFMRQSVTEGIARLENITKSVMGGVEVIGNASTSAIRRKYLDEVSQKTPRPSYDC
jgi:hypothetical protein